MSKYQSPINEYSLKVCLCRSKYLSQLKEMRTGEMRTGEMPPIHCEPMRSPTPALQPNHPNSQCITSLFSLCQDMLMPQSIRKLSDIQECFFFEMKEKFQPNHHGHQTQLLILAPVYVSTLPMINS